ncbi:GntR family transcriptional regulator [Streptomyces catenulae]|uniref:GntR family transcriptional regulator n=1 Tax=Streptomyces catenulae TaxID=66875 RepID=A0ABV2Z481_9ACTN|nr:GntR family transcriptional regulator [Streptomyces catenulae]
MTGPTAEGEGHDRRALHERIAADLRDDIMSGNLAPGAKLPSTTQLKARFDASNATIQKALGLLKGERLVVGRAGAAVTVREHRQRTVRPAASLNPAGPGEPYRWLTEAHRGETPARSELLEVAEAVPPGDVAEALGLPDGGTALLRRQILLIDGEPAELVLCFYPPDLAKGTALAGRRRIMGGSPTLLAELGHPPALSVDRVSARIPTQEQYEALKLPGHLPVLRTLRTVHSADGRPVEATVMIKAGHLYELRYEFTPS